MALDRASRTSRHRRAATSHPVWPSSTVSSAPPARGGDHRPTRRLRLDGGDAELLDAGNDHRAGARVQLDELLVAGAAEELGLGIGLAAGRRGRVPSRRCGSARRLAAPPRARRRTRLCADQLGDDQQRVAWLAGREAVGLDRRVDDRELAPVEAPDPLARELRVGDVGVDAAAGCEIPPAHASAAACAAADAVAREPRRALDACSYQA